jgi:N-acetylmuramic acid 6-phosphate etherase
LADEVPTTEQQNPRSLDLDALSAGEIVRLMNEENCRIPAALEAVLPQVAAAVELLVGVWEGGGRWIYVGAGTSGRVAAMDAAECPPTFGVPADRVLAVLAGGEAALLRAVEGAEDDRAAAVRDLEARNLTPKDAVIGLAASGRTPYTLAAVRYASELGCATVGISNNRGTELARAASVGIEAATGPEVVTGSTRLKAGTAQKMVLNMLSTAAFARLNKVYGNWMVDLRATNEKLRHRARRIVREITGAPDEEAAELLRAAGGSVKVAVVMGQANTTAGEARRRLADARGNVRRALDLH